MHFTDMMGFARAQPILRTTTGGKSLLAMTLANIVARMEPRDLPVGLSGQFRDDGGKRARSPGSAKETVKTIACGTRVEFALAIVR